MSEITDKTTRIDLKAINEIKEKLINTLDSDDLNVPINIGTLARYTRKWGKITPRNNQPYFEQRILKKLEAQGYCKINPEDREVTFIKLPKEAD